MTRSITFCLVMLAVFATGVAHGDKPVDLIVGESQFFDADNVTIRSV